MRRMMYVGIYGKRAMNEHYNVVVGFKLWETIGISCTFICKCMLIFVFEVFYTVRFNLI